MYGLMAIINHLVIFFSNNSGKNPDMRVKKTKKLQLVGFHRWCDKANWEVLTILRIFRQEEAKKFTKYSIIPIQSKIEKTVNYVILCMK